MRRLARSLPPFVVLMAIGFAAMAVPMAYGVALRDYGVARAFLYSGALGLFFVAMIAIAGAATRREESVRGQLMLLLFVYALLPLFLAIPFAEATDAGFGRSWWEMVSALTTTGASLFDPADLAPPLHLWRAMVGWMGGFFTLVVAVAILAPLNLGGFEVLSGATAAGSGAAVGAPGGAAILPRMGRLARELFPAYGGLTLMLWILLVIAGESSFVAACHAMATLSTSGISPLDGLTQAGAGTAGEMLIALFLVFALSRRLMPGDRSLRTPGGTWRDPELRTATILIVGLSAVLFLRHWIGAIELKEGEDAPALLGALWGTAFTVLSFLTTTGFESSGWFAARAWSGLDSPGLILLGLTIIGGGVATTAGGVRLLRVYALFRHGERETERLIHPRSVGGAGQIARRMRRQGAQVAWVFFMLFALSIAVVTMALSLSGHNFETSVIFAVSALSTTGPMPGVAGSVVLYWSDLDIWSQAVLAVAMIVGRLETLAIIALLNPDFWRS